MAALREDVMADEAPVNRQRRSPVSPFLLSPFKWAAEFCDITGRSRSGYLRRALQDRTHANARGGAGARSFKS